jgi:hypothetical protein
LIDYFLLSDDDLRELGANMRRKACEIFHLAFLLVGTRLESE